MKNVLKKLVLALTFVVGLMSIPDSMNEVKAQSAQEFLPNNGIVSIFPQINNAQVLNVDIGGREGNVVTLWDRAWSGDRFVAQQNWIVEYDGTRGDNVVLLKSLTNNSVLAWDTYGTRKIIAQPYNYTDRQYWIVEPAGDSFKLRSYYIS